MNKHFHAQKYSKPVKFSGKTQYVCTGYLNGQQIAPFVSLIHIYLDLDQILTTPIETAFFEQLWLVK